MNSDFKIVIIGDGYIGKSIFNFLISCGFKAFIFNRKNINELQLFLQNSNNIKYLLNCSGIGHPSLLENNQNEYTNEIQHINSVIKIVKRYSLFLIQYSSAAACGYNYDFEEIFFPNEQNNTLYGRLKCEVENAILADVCPDKFVILRLFSVYGIGLKKQLFFDLHNKYITNDHLFKLNSVLDERNFVAIDDVCKSTLSIINNINISTSNIIVNISNYKPVKIALAIEIGYKILNKIYSKDFIPNISEGRGDLVNNFVSMHPVSSSLSNFGHTIHSDIEENLYKYYLWLSNINN